MSTDTVPSSKCYSFIWFPLSVIPKHSLFKYCVPVQMQHLWEHRIKLYFFNFKIYVYVIFNLFIGRSLINQSKTKWEIY